MTELRVLDLFTLSAVLGAMIGTMAFFMHIFANGMDVSDLRAAMRTGALFGGSAAVVMLTTVTVRYIERGRRLANVEVSVDPLARLQMALQPVEDAALSLPWASESPWAVDTHVRRDRGVMTVDLHDLDRPQAREVVEILIAGRPWIGRVRIITGRGLHSKTIPKLRPMVIERLRGVVGELDWELLMKKGSVTLRPIGTAPTPARFLFRFVFLGGPITIAFAFAFRDLAGEGAYGQGRNVGVVLGLILSALLASYRERQ